MLIGLSDGKGLAKKQKQNETRDGEEQQLEERPMDLSDFKFFRVLLAS